MSNVMQEQFGASAASVALVNELQQALYREARMLDGERYDDWVAMLADDLHYHMPSIATRYRADKTDQIGDLNRAALYNDSREDIKKRLGRLATGTAWSEDPATRFTHLISNVEVELTSNDDEYRVYSAFLVYRSRNECDQDTLIGNRVDLWRRTPQGLKLARRLILLKQNLLMSKNLNMYL